MICTFLPPHILEGMARSSRPELARRALETLALTERLRGGQRYRAAATAGRTRGPEAREARAVFTARHRTALPGSLERREGEPPVPDRAANEAYDATGATWTFYREASSGTRSTMRAPRSSRACTTPASTTTRFGTGRRWSTATGTARSSALSPAAST